MQRKLLITDLKDKTATLIKRYSRIVVFLAIAVIVFPACWALYAFAGSDEPVEVASFSVSPGQIKLLVFNLLGGVALLIYGINRMGEGLQKAAGGRMREILGRLTGTPLRGVLVGAGVTSLIQSSSATTVMVIGFVNARLMTLVQAVGVIIGANIGTTITGQLIAFKLTDYALPILAIGVAIHFFTKRKFIKNVGLFLLGFGVLFLGLNLMADGVHFLKNDPAISQVFQQFGDKPILGVLAGALMTALIQSSSATIGIVIALVSGGMLDLSEAVPIIMGFNIGTCITAGLASLGASRNAKRAAFAHVMFNVIGTVIVLFFLQDYIWLVSKTADSLPRQAANAHTIFNVLNALVFLPFVPLYARAIEKIIPGPSMDKREAVHLDDRLLSTPAIALEQAIRELARMTAFVVVSLRSVEKAMRTGNLRWIDDVNEDEEAVDELHHQITDYLVAISERALAAEISETIPSVLHCVDDVERIGDMAVRLKDILEEKITSKAVFSDSATTDLGNLQSVAVHTLEETQRALAYRDITIARRVLAEKSNMEDLVRQIHENHLKRLCDGKCQVRAGVFFLEMIKRYENIGTRCRDICRAVVKHLGEGS